MTLLRPFRRTGAIPRAVAVSALAGIAVLALGSSGSGAAEPILLGSGGSAKSSCPADCLVEARVTGYQTSIEGLGESFVVPARGRIVSWSMKLGLPAREDIKDFNQRFGESKARLSILKPVRRVKGERVRKPTYRLVRGSKVERLRRLFGSTASFSLQRPLKVARGQVVALTIPTWAPAFAVGQSKQSRWRASRTPTSKRGGCFTNDGLANLKAGAPHQELASTRAYGCSYRGARLLYWATFIKG